MNLQEISRVRSKPLKRVDRKTLRDEIRNAVEPTAKIMTDENADYEGIRDEFGGGHHTVKHSAKEYVREEDGEKIHVNTGESFFALIKRGHYGVYHQMSKHHLHRYCDEFNFRWNHRKVEDAERREIAIQ